MNLIDNHSVSCAQHGARPFRRDQQVQRLWGCDEEIWRALEHRGPLGGGGIPGTHGDADLRRGQAQLSCDRGDLVERPLEVLPDVDREGLQRRDVDNLRAVLWVVACFVRAVNAVYADQECSKGLPGSSWGRDQRVPASCDLRPAFSLRGRRPSRKPPLEPRSNSRMERVQHPATVTQPTDNRPGSRIAEQRLLARLSMIMRALSEPEVFMIMDHRAKRSQAAGAQKRV